MKAYLGLMYVPNHAPTSRRSLIMMYQVGHPGIPFEFRHIHADCSPGLGFTAHVQVFASAEFGSRSAHGTAGKCGHSGARELEGSCPTSGEGK